jgi:DNA-binding NtrC family response regulator
MAFGETILIVGDEQNLRTTLAAILQRAGYVITTSGSAGEALQYLREKCFDLVFLDLKMTELNGIELLPEIKHRHPGIPVIMLTAMASIETPEPSDELSAAGYLFKPIDPARIVACADEVINKSRSIKQQNIPTKEIHTAPRKTDLLKG